MNALSHSGQSPAASAPTLHMVQMWVALATAIAFATVRGKPPWANRVTIQAPSATLELITVGFGPKNEKLYVYDESLAAASRYQDFTKVLTDRDTVSDSGAALNALQTLDRVYIGLKRRTRGPSAFLEERYWLTI